MQKKQCLNFVIKDARVKKKKWVCVSLGPAALERGCLLKNCDMFHQLRILICSISAAVDLGKQENIIQCLDFSSLSDMNDVQHVNPQIPVDLNFSINLSWCRKMNPSVSMALRLRHHQQLKQHQYSTYRVQEVSYCSCALRLECHPGSMHPAFEHQV